MAAKLTAISVQTLEKTTSDSVCAGLRVIVRGGSRSYVIRHGAKSYTIGTVEPGSRNFIGLKDARDRANEIRGMARKGIAVTTKAIAPVLPASTFKQDSITHHGREQGLWRSSDHSRQWLQAMELHAFPTIGATDTAKVSVADVVAVLKPLWETKHRTALRLHNRIKAVIDYTMKREPHRFPTMTNPATSATVWLDKVRTTETPRKSIPWREAPALYANLAGRQDQASNALRFLMLCCTPRANEVIGARWSEIVFSEDLDVGSPYGATWHLPGSRMKSGKARDIPLSDAAVALLRTIPRTSEFIFPGRAGKVVGGRTYGRKREHIGGEFVAYSGRMQHDAMQNLLRNDLKMDLHTHGLRSTFRTWASDHAQTVRDHDAAQIALDHVIGNKVARAYDRSDMMLERRQLAERWAAFLGA